MYHYVFTRDYPYSIGCFRGTPTYVPLPPPPLGALVMSLFIITWENIVSVFQPLMERPYRCGMLRIVREA